MPRTVTNARQRHFHSQRRLPATVPTPRAISPSPTTPSRLFQLPLSPSLHSSPHSPARRRARNVTSVSSSGPTFLPRSFSRERFARGPPLYFRLPPPFFPPRKVSAGIKAIVLAAMKETTRTRRVPRVRDRRKKKRSERRRGTRVGGWLGRRVCGDRARGEGARRLERTGGVGEARGGTEGGVGSHYVEGGDVTDGDGWLHVRQV